MAKDPRTGDQGASEGGSVQAESVGRGGQSLAFPQTEGLSHLDKLGRQAFDDAACAASGPEADAFISAYLN